MNSVVKADVERVILRNPEYFSKFVQSDLVITGASGFIGSWLVAAWICSRNFFGGSGKLVLTCRSTTAISSRFGTMPSDKDVILLDADIRELLIEHKMKNPVFIHAATASSARLNSEDPLEMINVIVEGTKRAIASAKQMNASKFVFLSSGAVYGGALRDGVPVGEDDLRGPDLRDRRFAYHEAKRLAELICQIEAQGSGIELAILRLFTFVGAYLPIDTHFAIGNFIKASLAGDTIAIKSDGKSVRSYQYAADLAALIVIVSMKSMQGSVYNVGSSRQVSILELANLVRDVMESNSGIEIQGMNTHTPNSFYVPDITRLENELSWNDTFALEDAILRTANALTDEY